MSKFQFYLAGIIILLFGFEAKRIDSFTLNGAASQMVNQALGAPATGYVSSFSPAPLRTVDTPEWLGYLMLTVGSVSILHGLAMKNS
jgi:hypothetical protein